ncbi:hypothetical protein [Mucilaginibacter antarcticus]|uniref:hypothetical protein n=1 Tax=Mucilaginibacter antarcticus TaxID=1855725 RepID=UPI003625DC8E
MTIYMEMSGSLVSGIIRYKVGRNKQVQISRDIIFPQLRKYTKSNESMYRAYLRNEYADEVLPTITVSQKKFEPGILDSIRINGKISFYFKERNGIRLVRSFFPAMDSRCFVEKWSLINTGKTAQTLTIGATAFNQQEEGWLGTYYRNIFSDAASNVTIMPGEKYDFGVYFTAQLNNEAAPATQLPALEHNRNLFLDSLANNLVVNSPNKVINTLFYFSKIRAAESIFKSRLGLVYSPGVVVIM